MKVEINNLTDFPVKDSEIVRLIEWLAETEPTPAETVSVAFVDDDRMKEMNEKFYNEKGTTDVLTFIYGDETIEITLNPYQHRRQASDVDNTLNEETTENLVHGYLHACGYDHLEDEGEHLRRQRELMDRLFEMDTEPALVAEPEEFSS